jgi:hypothetical protein
VGPLELSWREAPWALNPAWSRVTLVSKSPAVGGRCYLSNSGTEIHDGKPLPSGPRAGREFACAYGAVLITVGKAATETKDSHLRSHDSPGSSRSPVWRVITLQITDCQSTYSTYTILLLYWAEYHSTLAAHPRTSDTVQANVPGREPLFGLLCNAPDPSPHRLMQQELPNC